MIQFIKKILGITELERKRLIMIELYDAQQKRIEKLEANFWRTSKRRETRSS